MVLGFPEPAASLFLAGPSLSFLYIVLILFTSDHTPSHLSSVQVAVFQSCEALEQLQSLQNFLLWTSWTHPLLAKLFPTSAAVLRLAHRPSLYNEDHPCSQVCQIPHYFHLPPSLDTDSICGLSHSCHRKWFLWITRHWVCSKYCPVVFSFGICGYLRRLKKQGCCHRCHLPTLSFLIKHFPSLSDVEETTDGLCPQMRVNMRTHTNNRIQCWLIKELTFTKWASSSDLTQQWIEVCGHFSNGIS